MLFKVISNSMFDKREDEKDEDKHRRQMYVCFQRWRRSHSCFPSPHSGLASREQEFLMSETSRQVVKLELILMERKINGQTL